jgi:hypothetical protein
MARRLKSSTLVEFSARLVRLFGLPRGSEIRVYRKKTGRRVRSDSTVKWRAIDAKNIERLPDSSNVRELLDEALGVLSTDLEARGCDVYLYAPDGNRLNGNTLLGTVRSLEPIASEHDGEEFDTFIALLENSGLEDISLQQAGRLYRQLDQILEERLRISLARNAERILADRV